ncbi:MULTISPECIES: SPOR domain-containing protein [unclassified Agrobacterium]|uniref:SPOR domain-containing protein n=1 Tax=unclassified Agrobacterium TaxID=2632611 RepID=UPI00036854EB|nr:MULTISPECIES: SPOR domain-containing protein [unclassified Agrobacterium]SNB59554.1 Sporulation related domain-containing protein [Agrobacterium sp. 719_389]
MVEKNVAYNRDTRSEGFADNDPLAELARIVGFEDRPSHAGSEAAPRAASPATRREPEFNLEDELLREFEVYDAPHADPVVLDPANDVRAGIHPNDFMQRVESVFARREPELAPVAEPAPVAASAPEVREEPLPEIDQAYIHNYVETTTQDIRADFRDDAGAVAEVFDVHSRQSRPAEPMVYQPVAQQAAWEEPQAAEPVQPEWHAMPELPADVSSNVQSYQPEPQAFDLADEVEIAVAEEAPAPISVRPPSHGGRSSLEFSSLRLPLANFGARRDVSAVDPKRVEPRSELQPAAARIEPQVEAAPAPAVVQAVETAPSFAPSVAETFTPAAEPLAFEVAEKPAAKHLSPMDELIYDVAKYSIPGRGETPLVQDVPAAKVEPPVVAAAPVKAAPIAAAAPAAPAEELDFTDFAGFNDDDFELALDDLDLDLDLSEIAEAEVAPAPVPQPVRQQPVAPVAVAAVAPQPVREQPAPQPRPAPVAAPVAAVPAQPRPAVAAAPQPVAPQTLESLPFDPSQIGETEEHPETIAEMDVPELPVGVFEPKPAARRHEEDLDIDTELATLFAPAVAGGLDRHKHAENRGAAQARPVQAPEEADEFERALEEDFRRSMQEAAASRGSAPRDAENTYVDHQAAYRDEDERGGRRWIMPVAAAIGLVLIGGGVYALVSGGSSSTGSNGAPVIISADNDPMKVVPENPGGRVVPNQDKAVYDRVAGGSAADPKQPALISSNEQPVDVVQRTLIPEQLPLEGENDADMETAGTPVGETEDPRLLSPEEKAAQNEGSAATGVSPRKVRTMIVKPDGTLVAQEVEVPAAQPPKADKVEELAAPQTAKPGEGAPAVIAASRVPVAPEQAAQPQANTPAAAAKPAAQSAAPLPAARPSSQPANVVATVTNQGNVRPATAPAQPQAAQQQTAAATPAATSTPSAGGYYIQIASLPSQAEAQKSYQNMSAKFGSVIGGRGVDIKAAEIAGKGTFYRVRIPAGDKNEAVALCEKFRSAGGSCLVAR